MNGSAFTCPKRTKQSEAGSLRNIESKTIYGCLFIKNLCQGNCLDRIACHTISTTILRKITEFGMRWLPDWESAICPMQSIDVIIYNDGYSGRFTQWIK